VIEIFMLGMAATDFGAGSSRLWIELNDWNFGLLRNLQAQERLSRCEMTGVAAIEHLLVCFDELRAVLCFDGIADLLERSFVDWIENFLQTDFIS
jgi:hypothetical protein